VATDERAELDRIQRQAAREIAALFRPLAEALPELVRRETENGTRPLTEVARIRIMYAVDAYLDAIYGRFPGDASALEDIIVHWANVARSRPVRRAVADLRRRAGQRLAEAMEGEHGAANA
jgi:hypothetical protein